MFIFLIIAYRTTKLGEGGHYRPTFYCYLFKIPKRALFHTFSRKCVRPQQIGGVVLTSNCEAAYVIR